MVGHRRGGGVCTQAMPRMPLSTISTGEQREAEPEVAFLEDISEAVPAGLFPGRWAVLGGCAIASKV